MWHLTAWGARGHPRLQVTYASDEPLVFAPPRGMTDAELMEGSTEQLFAQFEACMCIYYPRHSISASYILVIYADPAIYNVQLAVNTCMLHTDPPTFEALLCA